MTLVSKMNSSNHQFSMTNEKLAPETVVEILAKHGTIITTDEAAKVLEFFHLLANLTLDQYEEGYDEKMDLK